MSPEPSFRRLALSLAIAGLIPFLAASGAVFNGDAGVSAVGFYALSVYAAVILSFLGGVHWGVALMAAELPQRGPGPTRTARTQLVIGVLPALTAWSAMILLQPALALMVMGLGFAAQLVIDLWFARRGTLPGWYGGLRIPPTVVVCICLWLVAWKTGF